MGCCYLQKLIADSATVELMVAVTIVVTLIITVQHLASQIAIMTMKILSGSTASSAKQVKLIIAIAMTRCLDLIDYSCRKCCFDLQRHSNQLEQQLQLIAAIANFAAMINAVVTDLTVSDVVNVQ